MKNHILEVSTDGGQTFVPCNVALFRVSSAAYSSRILFTGTLDTVGITLQDDPMGGKDRFYFEDM